MVFSTLNIISYYIFGIGCDVRGMTFYKKYSDSAPGQKVIPSIHPIFTQNVD